MNRTEIEAKTSEIWGEANKLFTLKNKVLPSISFFSKSGIAGKAWYMEHKVEFNEILALENSSAFETTIAHELAHLITNQVYPNAKQHHGPEFKSVMERLGYDPRTYHSYDTKSVSTKRVKVRYEYACVTCGKTYEVARPTHLKAQSSVGRYVCTCKSPIKFTGNERSFV